MIPRDTLRNFYELFLSIFCLFLLFVKLSLFSSIATKFIGGKFARTKQIAFFKSANFIQA